MGLLGRLLGRENQGADTEVVEAPALPIPLTEMQFSAEVDGLFAMVTCTQRFENKADKPLEASYVFPLPPEASVTACTMKIGEKIIAAELKERAQAKQDYDQAVSAGHHASLLEQNEANVFTMNVGGIEPGEAIEVNISYQQRVGWQAGGGRLTIPLVHAPRFVPPGVATSYQPPQVPRSGTSYTAGVELMLRPGFPCVLTSPSHELLVDETTIASDGEHRISLVSLACDRDVVLYYRCTATVPSAAAHVGTSGGENFAMLTIVPPAEKQTKAKDVVLCLDRSGSMSGIKLAGLKVIVEKVIKNLASQNLPHRVGVVVFDDHVDLLQRLQAIDDGMIAKLRAVDARGGTMAGAALDHCFGLFDNTDHSERERYILFVGDGQTQDRWSKIHPHVRVIAVGIDTALNAEYLQSIARETGGTSIAVYPGEDYDAVAGVLAGLLSGPVARDITVTALGQALEVEGQRSCYEGMPAVLTFKSETLPDEVEVSGTDREGKKKSFAVSLKDAPAVPHLHQLWAREKLRGDLPTPEQVTLSLKHGVLCRHTAFVAVSLKDVPGQKPERVEVPVSLPTGWDYDAVFGATGAVRTRGVRTRGAAVRGAAMAAPDDVALDAVDSLLCAFDVDDAMDSAIPAPAVPQSKTIALALDELDHLVKGCEVGVLDLAAAAKEWQALEPKLIAEEASWTPVQRAKCLCLLLKLQRYGFKVNRPLMRKVRVAPPVNDREALAFWSEAQALMGLKVS